MEHIISGPLVYAELGVLQNTTVIVRNGRIHGISKKDSHTPKATLRFPNTYHLLPGFIDMHVHGANNCDVMDAKPEALQVISKQLSREGTTSFLATTMTAAVDEIEATLANVRDFINTQDQFEGATIVGVHLEGPFISKKKAGAQNRDHVLNPDSQLIEKWQNLSSNAIKLVTLAPELSDGLELIRYLKNQNIIASAGHSDATYAETVPAIAEGITYATHLFNAMREIHQREPGIAIALLLSEQVTTELIADGVHLHPAMLQLVFQLKRKEKMILATDSMRAKCLGNGVYELGGQSVEVKGDLAQLADGTLAGSLLTLPEAIQNIMRFTRCSLSDASKMVSENPAKILGIYNDRGSISLGKKADLVVLDDKYRVVLTFCGGRIVYRAPSH